MHLNFGEIPQFFSLSVARRALFVGVALFGLGVGACDSKSVGEEQQCKVGDTKEVDCNTCSCEAGQWSCTEKACAAYDPCEGSSCGDACTVCDPADPDCVETQELKACNAMGQCVSDTGDLCPGAQCLEGETKKVECNDCDCQNGEWSCTEKGCDAYEPCLGSSCGDACTVCDPNDKDCVETEVIKACDAEGTCVADVPDLCEPAYQPCADKICGEQCKICDPNDEDCVETQEVKVCDAEGQCVSDTGDICQ